MNNNKKILVLDDEISILDSIRRMLYMDGFTVVDTTTSIEEAVKSMKETTYDVVLFDFLMLEGNGYTFLKEAEWDKNKTSLILMTGFIISEIIEECFNLGISAYILKPFSKKDLLDVLTKPDKGVI